ncbi:MAG: UDP-4-amino-4,6-dideoxy-N-acetyl-beta-L-altrosamine transaminase [Alphaproteobacteria bacterium]|jgi:UDP-4-amino-4,6-dideoxy-N-acetyl-beta-L-altrosamine transaminase
MIPYGKQNINDNDINAVIDVLKSSFITQGPAVPRFEQKICHFTGAHFGVAVNSATSALHIACLALGIQKNDLVWTSPNSFVASANCALYCGANIDFVDIDLKTYNLCADKLEEKLKTASQIPKVVIPVAFAGQSANMEKIKALSQQYGFYVIEDASHAIGGSYKNKPIGCGDYADITIFSFHPVKIITTAEGGIAVTNNETLAQKMALLRSHGITRDAEILENPTEGGWYYEQHMLGFNYRMTEMQAALGCSQMDRLESFIEKRHKVKDHYHKILQNLPITLPYQEPNGYSALHLYPICLKDISQRKAVFTHLRSHDIGVNVHYIPIHTHPFYQKLGFKWGDFPIAEAYYHSAISIPMYPDLTDENLSTVKETLTSAFKSIAA